MPEAERTPILSHGDSSLTVGSNTEEEDSEEGLDAGRDRRNRWRSKRHFWGRTLLGSGFAVMTIGLILYVVGPQATRQQSSQETQSTKLTSRLGHRIAGGAASAVGDDYASSGIAEPAGEAKRNLYAASASSMTAPRLDPIRERMEDFTGGKRVQVASSPKHLQKLTRGPPFGHPSTSMEYPQYSGFTLWLAEEFDEPLDLDSDPIWTYSDGGLAEGKVRFVKEAIQFRDGKMMIEVSDKGLPQGHTCSHAEVGYVGYKSHTSGEFRTRLNLFRYGRYEVRMKAPIVKHGNPGANGNYISTMFAFRAAKFRHWSEIDIEVTGDAPNAVTANVLKADGATSWSPGIQDSSHILPSGMNARTDFNTYAFEWLPDKITWYLNGKVIRVHRGGRVQVPSLSTKIMMNLWVFDGSGFGGPAVSNNQYPLHNEYDWFRFYKWDGDTRYPCATMDKACLSVDDLYLTSNNPCDGIAQEGTVHGKSPCVAPCSKYSDLSGDAIASLATPFQNSHDRTLVLPTVAATSSSSTEPNLEPIEPVENVRGGSCDIYGCESFVADSSCQCNSKCQESGNCCSDFERKCVFAVVAMLSGQQHVPTGVLPYGHPSASLNYPTYPGFTLWVAEEFDAPIDLDTDPIWTYSDGGLSEGKVRFIKEAIQFKDGKMTIEVSDKGLLQGNSCSHAEVGYVSRKPLTSGEFRSRLNLFRYGRYEVSMKAPTVQRSAPNVNGNYISTLFVYRDAKFRHWAEIDIEVTGDGSNAVTTNVLKADGTGTWSPGIQDSAHLVPRGFDSRSAFNTYAFEWLPDRVTWFLNGNVVRVHRGGRVPVPSLSTKIMMNLWVFNGGGFGGRQIGNNRYPFHSEYDWFRFYKWDQEVKYPCAAMDTSCLTDDDMYLTSNNPCDGIQQIGSLYGRTPCVAPCSRTTLDMVGNSTAWEYTPGDADMALDAMPASASSAIAPNLEPVVFRGEVRAESCAAYGCVNYAPDHACQCNELCVKLKSCCSDYSDKCGVALTPHIVQKVDGSSLPMGHPSASVEYPKHKGFTLWLVEEFENPLDLTSDPIWTYSDGGLTEGKVRFVKDAIHFKDGKMIIEVSNKGIRQGNSCSHAEKGYVGVKSHTSGEMRTRLNLFRYGRYEVNMKAPSVHPGDVQANGNYISTMFAYRDGKFRHWAEIDIEVTGDKPNAVTANVLKADGVSTWSPTIQDSLHLFPRDINARSSFHTYAFEWLPEKITWFIDGKVVRVHRGGRVPVPNLSAKIMMNLWVFDGVGFGGPNANNNVYPMQTEYEWFRFYKWDGDNQYPCRAMDHTCLTEDDVYLTGNNPCDGVVQQGELYGRKPCTAPCGSMDSRNATSNFTAAYTQVGLEILDEQPATSASAVEPMLDPVFDALDSPASCRAYGCTAGLDRSHECQCNPECAHYKNCCADYILVCAASGPPPIVVPADATTLPYGHPSKLVIYPMHEGFTLWVVEEFDTPLDLDTDPIWTYSDGGLSEGKVRFVKDAIQFKDGKMIIEVSTSGLPQGQPCSHAEVGYVSHKSHTSGEFRSRLNLFRYGRYEMSMKAPSVRRGDISTNGNFIATLFAYRDAKFRHWNEIDIEVIGERPNSVTSNVLKADHTASWSPGIQELVRMYPDNFNARTGFHTYAFEWLPNKITWFIDDKIVRVHTGGRVPVPSLSTKIMMNLWVFNGGGFGGPHAENNQYPMHSEYDWFRFYKWNGDTKYPCAAMDQTCLTEDDMYLTGNNPCDNIAQRGTVFGRQPCTATCKRH